MDYQKLYDYMSNEHGVDLLESDVQEICNIVNEMQAEDLRQTDVSGSVLPFDIEYALEAFRAEQKELFDDEGKRYTDGLLSNRNAENMLNLINLMEAELLKGNFR